ncbi:hypothetical protein [Streptomyces sp. NPDC018045]|uniref:hypothetical protein n=1 Tax=Streptomyces sp. NPDC018045 TaxID=3365037 RepID=UPI0037891B2D
MPETMEKVGSVARDRYEEIMAELRAQMRADHRIQFTVGDRALEIEPMRGHGGSMPNGDDDLFTVEESLQLLSEDTGIPVKTIGNDPQAALDRLALAQGTAARARALLPAPDPRGNPGRGRAVRGDR